MRPPGPWAPGPAARHVRQAPGLPLEAPGPAEAPVPAPPTLSLMLSRRARRQAAEAAAAASLRDPRLDVIERVLTGLRLAGDAAALALSAVAWVWVAGHRAAGPLTGDATADATGAGLAGGPGAAAGGGANPLLHPLAGVSGTSLLLVMLLACLMMAPSVNPFYAAPPEGRLLQLSRTAAFAVLAISTVAVVTNAAR